jgi:hypothetical protein
MLDRYPMSAAQTDKFGCAKPFNEVSQYFNHKVNETIVQLREELSKATIIYVDVYTVKYNLISHAQKYGERLKFRNVFHISKLNIYMIYNFSFFLIF